MQRGYGQANVEYMRWAPLSLALLSAGAGVGAPEVVSSWVCWVVLLREIPAAFDFL
jgi:hypothetical protein